MVFGSSRRRSRGRSVNRVAILDTRNLTDFRLKDVSPYSYRGDSGSPMLLYKAKNNRGFALLNAYLKASETLDDFEPNESMVELLKLTGHQRRSRAQVPDHGTRDFYVNVTIPPETLMLENLALQGTEINYIDDWDEYDGRWEFQNPVIGATWQDAPDSFYIMYALGKTPFRRNRLALNYREGFKLRFRTKEEFLAWFERNRDKIVEFNLKADENAKLYHEIVYANGKETYYYRGNPFEKVEILERLYGM